MRRSTSETAPDGSAAVLGAQVPALSARLRKTSLPDGRPFYTPRRARLDVARVSREVAEYFQDGITLGPGQVIFDVGANVGLFSLHAAERCGGDATIYGFEPIPDLHAALQTNFAEHPVLRKTRHRLFQCGLTSGPEVTSVDFYYFRNHPCDSTYDIEAKRRDFEDAFAAFGARARERTERALPGAAGRWAGRAAGAFVADLPKGTLGRWLSDRVTGMEKVRCTLDTLAHVIERESVPEIHLLKIDVEGAELDVLRGLDASGWKKVHQIVLEGHDKDGRLREVVQLIEARGLQIDRVGKPDGSEELGLDNFMLTARRATASEQVRAEGA